MRCLTCGNKGHRICGSIKEVIKFSNGITQIAFEVKDDN